MFVNSLNSESYFVEPDESKIRDQYDNDPIFDLFDIKNYKTNNEFYPKYDLKNDKDNFYLIINLILPGNNVSLVYYKNKDKLSNPNWVNFINSNNKDDLLMIQTHYLNTYLIPSKYYKPDPLCKTTDVTFFKENNYLEINVDINQSSLVRYLFNIIKGMAYYLIGDISFLVKNKNDNNLTILNLIRYNKFSFDGQYNKI